MAKTPNVDTQTARNAGLLAILLQFASRYETRDRKQKTVTGQVIGPRVFGSFNSESGKWEAGHAMSVLLGLMREAVGDDTLDMSDIINAAVYGEETGKCRLTARGFYTAERWKELGAELTAAKTSATENRKEAEKALAKARQAKTVAGMADTFKAAAKAAAQ